jgi:hypothetical protein
MKNVLWMLVVALFMAACGSDENKEIVNEGPQLNIDAPEKESIESLSENAILYYILDKGDNQADVDKFNVEVEKIKAHFEGKGVDVKDLKLFNTQEKFKGAEAALFQMEGGYVIKRGGPMIMVNRDMAENIISQAEEFFAQ